MFSKAVLRFLSAVLLFAAPSAVIAADDDFLAVGVQFEIEPGVYQSEDAFFSAVEDSLKEICNFQQPDLVVFPEYIGVFYQLIEFNEIINNNGTLQEALNEVLSIYPRFEKMADVFTKSAVCAEYFQRWSALAVEYNTSIIAGSCFVPMKTEN